MKYGCLISLAFWLLLAALAFADPPVSDRDMREWDQGRHGYSAKLDICVWRGEDIEQAVCERFVSPPFSSYRICQRQAWDVVQARVAALPPWLRVGARVSCVLETSA